MTDRNTEEKALQKLREVLAKEELKVFTEDEILVLRNVIRVYRGLLALGWMGSFTRNVILIVMSIVTAYLALTGAITQWVKRLVEGA